MASIIETFGHCLDRIAEHHPAAARRLLLAAYWTYGRAITWFPDKRLPPSRQYLATVSIDTILKPLAHPERAMLTSIFTPCELIRVFDFHPMCAELYSAYINGTFAGAPFIAAAEAAGLPETFCSYHRITVGAALADVLKPPAAILNVSLACDANNLTFRFLADKYRIPHYYVDVPISAMKKA